MPPASTRHSVAKLSAAAALGTVLVGAASIVVAGWLIDGVEWVEGSRRSAAERSSIGDYFSGVSTLFSGLALLLLVATLLFQQRELRLQREELMLQREELTASRDELRRAAEADLRGLHLQMTQMAMADPSLAEVWNDLPTDSPTTLRQDLFANLTFSHYVLLYSWGALSEAELLAYGDSLLRSPAFRRYWNTTRPSKVNLPPESSEGRVFRLFEQALAERDPSAPPATR
ncbi:DUF6082 family protein [Streptomyces sp. NPDC006602]|uniref:DUF6082 family protein n=1 Tax=Streptomyces sp. NPDC006602 TaxID=3364751 RepID=UPI0036BC4A21